MNTTEQNHEREVESSMTREQRVQAAATILRDGLEQAQARTTSRVFPYQTMPPLTVEELAQLEASVLANGIQVPVLVDEHDVPIDGHNRLALAQKHGLECPRIVREGLTEREKIELSISLNIDRRHLTREQKRELIATSIAAAPELTDREHARRTGASPTTVGAVRAKLEESGEVSKLDTRTDPRGYEQPAAKPQVQRVTETQTIKHVTETPVEAPTPAASVTPAPALAAVSATEENARTTVAAIARGLETLSGFTYPEFRELVIGSWWALGSVDVPPSQAEFFTPEGLRGVAQGLYDTAAALEAHRG